MNKIAVFCDKLMRGALYLLLVVLPLFFLPWTFETLEFNKQGLLVVLVLIGGLAWLGEMIASRQAFFRRSFINWLVLFYAVIYVLSTIFSIDKLRSLLGASGTEKDGLVTVLCFILLYFIITNNVREEKFAKRLIYALFLGGGLAAFYTFVATIGLLPSTLFASRAMNTVGTLTGLGIFLSAIFVLVSPFLLRAGGEIGVKKISILNILLVVLLVLSLFLLVAIDTWMVWAGFVLALAVIIAFVVLKAGEIKNLSLLALPMAALVLAILFFFIQTPLAFNLPAEIMPSFSASSHIAGQTLQDNPLFGSGPSTFALDYSKHKPEGVNLTPLWDVQFDRSASRFLTMVSTTGLFGLISWLFLAVVLAIQSVAYLIKQKVSSLWLAHLGLTSAWILLVVARIFYSSNLTLEFLFWVLTALLVALTAKKVWEKSLEQAPRVSLGLSLILTLGIIFSISTFYLLSQRYFADYKFAQAVMAAGRGEELEKVVDYFDQAAAQNRWNDTYLRNLAQSLLAQINQELGKEVTEERAAKVQGLIAADINVAKRATEIGPKNSANWATLASIYQAITALIPGSADWAISSWQKAVELEPGNPYFYTELGKVYTVVADLNAQNLGAEDEKVKQEAKTKVNENLAKAEEQFNKAIKLKVDYAPAHFELAMVYSRQGKIKEAIAKLEAIRANLPNDIGVAFQLGLLYWQNKEQDKAVAELERTIELAPKFANARWYLAAIYEEQDKKDLAITQLEEILKTNPENETVKKKIEALKTPPPSETPPEMPEPIPEEPKRP